jgi:hypothetical protein
MGYAIIVLLMLLPNSIYIVRSEIILINLIKNEKSESGLYQDLKLKNTKKIKVSTY